MLPRRGRVGADIDDAEFVIMRGYHVLALLGELNCADAAMRWHFNLLNELHLAHVPEVDQAVVARAGKDSIAVLLQAGQFAVVGALEQALLVLGSYIPESHCVVVAARQECIFGHCADLLHPIALLKSAQREV